ncbi:MAG: DUF4276 family protein [Phycisphaerales bacterium]|nr:DUF4276 family protein [Phycisphaerales bacterium]
MNSRLFIEGGGESKDLKLRCREAFRKLLDRCGLAGRMPRLVASGPRNSAFDDFRTAHRQSDGDRRIYVGLLVDSEQPVADSERPWAHLQQHDGWECPAGATDEQVMLMTTCMESWIAADRGTLEQFFGAGFNPDHLPAPRGIEARPPAEVLKSLESATRNCSSHFSKGRVAFELIGRLNPDAVRPLLVSFARAERVLKNRLRRQSDRDGS